MRFGEDAHKLINQGGGVMLERTSQTIFNMFSPSIENIIISNLDRTLIITVD